MVVENNVPLQGLNTFHIVARAQQLLRIRSQDDVSALLQDAALAAHPKFVLGGGSNLVLTGDVKSLVLKVEIVGRRLLRETPKAYIVEAGAGDKGAEFLAWSLGQGMAGLRNSGIITGAVGGAPAPNTCASWG